MRNKLFWIVVILAVPTVCFFIVGIYATAKAPWFIAGFTYLVAVFTFLLWRATNNYAETTKELLNQSKKAFDQSKIVFRLDLVGKFLEYIDQLRGTNASADAIATSCQVRLLVLGRVNKPLAEELWEDLKNEGEGLRLAMEKYDASFREKLDKRVKE